MSGRIAPDRPVVIAGAGIGGLTAALTLHRVGIPVRVYESVARLEPLGVGINLLPHSVRVLTELGLAPALAKTAIETAALIYHNKLGQRIWVESRGLAAGHPFPQFSIHRGRLQALLFDTVRERLGPGAVVTGRPLESFQQGGGRVDATFGDRSGAGIGISVEAAVLIGADGIHSAVRKAFYPGEGAPCYSGRILWRAVTEGEAFLGGRTMIMAGHQRQKFVCYPICADTARSGRSLINWIAELETGETPPRQDWSRIVPVARFRDAFAGWRFDWLDIPALIDGADAVYEYPMVDRDPLPRWSFGRVTLLGDAAHPMYPIGSNGASQAILDAEAVAKWLAAEDVEAGLAGYEAERRPPTAAVVLANRENGPEQVMELAEQRAPGGFRDIHDVIPASELREIAERYRRLTTGKGSR